MCQDINENDPIMEPLGLRYCDSGTLFVLLSTLGNLDSAKLHTKVNEYFRLTFGAVGIILECLEISPFIKVRAIGRIQLPEALLFEANCDLAQRLRQNRGPTRIQKGQMEGKLCCELERVLKEEYNEKYFNSMFFPIEHPLEKHKYTYFVGLINFKDFEGCDKIYNGFVTECFRHCFGCLRSASNYDEEKHNSNRCSLVLESFVEILTSCGSNVLYDKVQQQAMNVFNASKCSVYLRDPILGLVPKVPTGGRLSTLENGASKKSNYTTTALKVAEMGKLINIKDVRCDPYYAPTNIPLTDECRSLLAFPLKNEGRLLGVVEVYDKNTSSLSFTHEDLEMTVPFANTVSFALEGNKIFYHFIDTMAKQQYMDCVFLRRVKGFDYDEIISVLNCKHRHNFRRITDFRFDPSVVPEKHEVCICLTIFETSGLLKKFRINRETFIKFLIKVKQAHWDLPFHNWNHALLTLHFVFVCINQYNLIKDRYVTIFEYFTLLMAALCHGLDYRGPTNTFQKTTGTVLASLFSSPGSVNQLHQLSQTLRLLTFPECNILQHVDDEEFYSFASLLRDMIADTNLAHHPKKIIELQAMIEIGYDVKNASHRRLCHYAILNCAQTCYACKPWSLCRKIGEQCFEEFFRKGDTSFASGVFEIPDFNEDVVKLPELNINFIEKICLPNYEFLSRICPLVHLCIMKIHKNLHYWREEKEKILASVARNMDDESED